MKAPNPKYEKREYPKDFLLLMTLSAIKQKKKTARVKDKVDCSECVKEKLLKLRLHITYSEVSYMLGFANIEINKNATIFHRNL